MWGCLAAMLALAATVATSFTHSPVAGTLRSPALRLPATRLCADPEELIGGEPLRAPRPEELVGEPSMELPRPPRPPRAVLPPPPPSPPPPPAPPPKRPESRAGAYRREVFERLDLSPSTVDRLLQSRAVRTMDPETLLARVNALRGALSPRTVGRVMTVPLVLGHDLPRTLHDKLEALESAVGLEADRVVSLAPGLLVLNQTSLPERVEAMRSALPGLDVRQLLGRAPRLLGRDPDKMGRTLGALSEEFAAFGDASLATEIIYQQPSLLGYSVDEAIAPKIRQLRALTSPDEWRKLTIDGSASSLARLLTASPRVIARLERVPVPEEGMRPVTTLLLMSRARFESAYGEAVLGVE